LRLHREAVAPLLPHGTDQADADPSLAAVIEAWDHLPEAVKAGILAMVEAVKR